MTSAVIVAAIVLLVATGVYLLRVAIDDASELDARDLAEREYEARRNRRRS